MAALLETLRCPFCRSRLTKDGESLRCTGCSRTFGRAANGIPLMLHVELPGAPEKLREAEGWLEKAKAEGWYEPDDAVDRVLPFVNRELGWNDPNWLAKGPPFHGLPHRYLPEDPGPRVPPGGGPEGWAARLR